MHPCLSCHTVATGSYPVYGTCCDPARLRCGPGAAVTRWDIGVWLKVCSCRDAADTYRVLAVYSQLLWVVDVHLLFHVQCRLLCLVQVKLIEQLNLMRCNA